MKSIYYRVAGIVFRVDLPESIEPERSLHSFRNFLCGEATPDFTFTLRESGEMRFPETVIIDESDSDLGHVTLGKSGDGHYVTTIGIRHRMLSDREFIENQAEIDLGSPDASSALVSMLRIAFSQAALKYRCISIHSSAVVLGGRAFLFLGSSGTGKSTHSALWLRNFPGARLLNDDNPAIRILDGRVLAYGTPWSGKTPCYVNENWPVGGIVRLRQAPYNRFTECADIETFVNILPSCSAVRGDSLLQTRLHDSLAEICAGIRSGVLECRPDDEAAILCENKINI
ncbi:MAG: phosphoenolpyruvate carboxykinase [Candidatus Cryptobacteroides sp.]